MSEIDRIIAAASRHGITLNRSDFKIIDGWPTLDGMAPDEWLEAMTMD